MSKASKKRSNVPTVSLVQSASKRQSVGGIYAAKILFEFRVVTDGVPDKMRLCEQRIVLVKASSAVMALRQVEREARADKRDYLNRDGSKVHFRFVGILDLLHLGLECEPNEVWYDLSRCLQPMERRHRILPKRKDLNAIKLERTTSR